MTTYPQPQYPGYPQQPQVQPQQAYPPQAPAQQYPPQQHPGYPPQQFAQPQFQQPQQAPEQVLVQGSLDDFYNQPTSGGGPSISWSNNGLPKPEGTTYAGIVARDVVNGDIQQQTDPKTGAPKFYRDGNPQYVMKVPLQVPPSAEFPDGEAVLFVRGQMRDELSRAMAEAGREAGGAPKGGETIVVQLVRRKPSRGGGMPMNVFAISYALPGQQPAALPQVQPQQQAPAQQYPPQQPQQFAQPQQPIQQVQEPQQMAPVQQAPVAQPAPVQQPQPAAQPPAQQAQPSPQPPAGLDPEQQALLARLTAQQG